MRWVRRPMRLGLGNAVEPGALIRRFGADALRLGYLLSLHSGPMELATAAESHLKRARRTVHRLNSKVTGLFHMTRHDPGGGQPSRDDERILARAAAASAAARTAYRERRLGRAGRLLTEVADDFARYAARAAARRRDGGEPGAVRATVRGVVAELAAGFSPVCPYLFEQLSSWTAARAPEPAS